MKKTQKKLNDSKTKIENILKISKLVYIIQLYKRLNMKPWLKMICFCQFEPLDLEKLGFLSSPEILAIFSNL